LEKIDTPNVKTIDELCGFLKTDSKNFIKTLIYRAINVELDLTSVKGCEKLERKKTSPEAPLVYAEAFFAAAIRGDLDVNETKLASILRCSEVELASDADVARLTEAPVGFAGPVGLKNIPVIADLSVTGMSDAVTGALEKDIHYKHAAYGRDFSAWMIEDIRTVKAGDRCSLCGKELYSKMGNELGHIFKLGYKYTRSMNVTYLDENGKSQIPTMGCYGIGIDRTLASVIEEHHDDAGIVWPVSIAPFHAAVIPIKYDGAVKDAADKLTDTLIKAGIEVLLDDRGERPGVKFNDADLTGIPWRVVIGDKGLALSPPQVEIKKRGEKETQMIDAQKAADFISEKIQQELLALKN